MSVRIGRAPHCEVRLTGPDVAAEVCRLQRRGQSWRLLPASSASPIFLEGRRLGGACVVPFGMPFRAGEYCFTLRHNRSAEPDWELYAGPAPPREETVDKPPVAEVEPDPPPMPHNLPLPTAVGRRIAPEPLVVEKRHEPKLWDPPMPAPHEQWETRWKALGAQVRSRALNKQKPPEVSRPSYQSDLEPIPLREARIPLIQVPAIPRPPQEPQQEAVIPPQSLFEDVQSEFEPFSTSHPASPEFEACPAVEGLGQQPLIPDLERSPSNSPPHLAPDNPSPEPPFISAEESKVCVSLAEAEPDDPSPEPPLISAEALFVVGFARGCRTGQFGSRNTTRAQ